MESTDLESSPECDYSVEFDRWLSFEHVDPMLLEDDKRCRCIGTFCGLLSGAGISIGSYLLAESTNIVFVGDLIVVVFLFLLCVLPIYGYWNLKYLRPTGRRTCIGDVMESTPRCFGTLYGISALVSLIIVHVLLRVSAYQTIKSDNDVNPMVWVVSIGTIILICEMLYCCYRDSKNAEYINFTGQLSQSSELLYNPSNFI